MICVVDDWLLRPQRAARLGPGPRDSAAMRALYGVLPVLIGAAVLRLLLSERLDFSAVLLAITVVTGVVWAFDVRVLRPRRAAAARAAGRDPGLVPEPGTVDYARSFFPVALVVLLVRAFIFEPFRIPSDSMMPTLLDGDFIIVNKYAYGLRLPVLNRKILAVGEPQRGDVVVFRYPIDPSTNYIKRLVGLPGDHVVVQDDRIIINGKPVPCAWRRQATTTAAIVNLTRSTSTSASTITRRSSARWRSTGSRCCRAAAAAGCAAMSAWDEEAPGCMRTPPFVGDVPPGQYLMMGDNRDNSDDGRSWGFVPEQNLVGKAT